VAAPSANGAGERRKQAADVAQLVEHSLGKGEVISSILIIGSMGLKTVLRKGTALAVSHGVR
jgi:hypothetical protein